jgi:acetyl-CoA carboxylase carboxyltransferase component
VITGVGTVNADEFGAEDASCVVVAYDYTVFAGTQGMQGHDKQDRIFSLAAQLKRPLVLFAEGGGGRPGDIDAEIRMVAGLYYDTFHLFGQLSAMVPLVGIANGRCFAGNAALLGSCDVVIATKSSSIGMGGPAMIEGGGLGIVRPEDVGPISVQAANGVVDLVVADEAAAVRSAKRYLSYFQGRLPTWTAVDQRLLRTLVPENRLRAYDMRAIIAALADDDSVTELRADYAHGMLTALIRIEGRPLGVIANNPRHLGGAIDAEGSDKAARFIQMCDAHGLPIVSLCDTPGFMVGTEIEKEAMVRRCCRMFVTAANISVPFMTVVIRKGYGLGSMAMAGGSFRTPLFVVSWPSGEFGGMGLEGNVRLGFKQELEAIADPKERDAEFKRRVAELYAKGRAINAAAHFEFDNVIDPSDTRRWVVRTLASQRPNPVHLTKTRTHIDTW